MTSIKDPRQTKKTVVGVQTATTKQKLWWKQILGSQDAWMCAMAQAIEYKSNFSSQYYDQRRFFLMYHDRDTAGLYQTSAYRKRASQRLLSFNVIASCIDTLISRVCAQLPTVQYLAENGDYTTEQKAKDLEFVVQSVIHKCKVHELFKNVTNDAAVCGTGLIHMRQHPITNEFIFDQIKTYELFHNYNDGYNENPNIIHIARLVNKYHMIAEYPDKEAILDQSGVMTEFHPFVINNQDCITVVHSYSRVGKRKTIWCSTGILEDKEFNLGGNPLYSDLPIISIRYLHDDRCFYGVGVCERLAALQLEINKLLRTAQRASHLMSIPKVFVNTASDIQVQQLNNDIGGVVRYSGPMPVFGPLGQVPSDLFVQFDRLVERAREEVGISDLAAQNDVPARLESGKAVSTYFHVQSARFSQFTQKYEELAVNFNDMFVSFLRMALEDGTLPESMEYVFGKSGKKLSLNDVMMGKDEFIIKVYPVNAFSNTPEQKYNQLETLVMSGMMSINSAKKLLKMPDVDSEIEFDNSEYNDLLQQMQDMADGIPHEPSPANNLQLALDVSKKAFFFFKNKKVPEDNLGLFLRYIESCTTTLDIQQKQMMAEQQQQMMQQMQQVQSIEQQGETE